MKMLEFKRPQPEPDKNEPRWNLGIDPKRVAAFVAAAVIGGFILGFGAARLLTKPEPSQQALQQPSQLGLREPASPASARGEASENPVSDFHRVTRIIRADTIEVDQIGPVKLIGVETPDGKQPKESYEVHGKGALAFVEKTLLNQDVRLELDPSNSGSGHKDELGQTLAYVYTRDGMMINSELVRRGLAFVKGFEQFRASNEFRGLERDAVQNSRGVWGPAPGTSAASPIASAPLEPSSSSSTSTERRKVTPLPPSAFGDNIPAVTSGTSSTTSADAAVFVSGGDKMYHKAGCELLDRKKRAISLSQARTEGYTACSRCYASTVLKAP